MEEDVLSADSARPVEQQSEQAPSEAGGFYKLAGRGWSFIVAKLKLFLGRNTASHPVDVHLGESSLISRRHAKIKYDFASKHFQLVVLGRNGLKLNGTLLLPAHGPVALESRDVLTIGGVEMAFLLPPKTARNNEKMRLAAERAAEVRRQDELEGVLPASAAPAASQGEAPKEKGLDLASYDAHDHSAHDALPGEDMPSRSRGADQSASSPKSPSRGKKRKREENSDSEEAFSKPSKKQSSMSRLQRRAGAVSMEGWTEDRIAKWTSPQHEVNPDIYYYDYNEPGEPGATGPWTAREESFFWARFKELGADGYWGTFSMAIPGRTGRQCEEFYRTLVAQGRVIDDRFEVNGNGEAILVRRESQRKPTRVVDKPKKVPQPEENATESVKSEQTQEQQQGQALSPQQDAMHI